ncbi:UDP-N-acetylmuramoyl-L-alanyl-D-glutamate--2,6-diaminopimelate ligase [Candidatus Endobugula sertula]|uniref:UDP-N-acetylmuramoyl-L-alanyl-D-glutamate--2,6-diaminopimelate ligase n=1 Tax=Candidatus Endobugula sertula TaxID=62101 RepID=A0A1D2QTW0_9GAMM|nr:UDP-N-acetylmuramoyl-L-alanyl-D-glutamate--2,6-diaminopimelate ligase [Candidatus Endobugula sertula]
MQSMTVGQLLPFINLPDVVSRVTAIGLSMDSREIEKGRIFVATPGVNTDGKQYIGQAIQQGAVAVFIDSTAQNDHLEYKNSIPIISIPDLDQLLSEIAGRFYGHPTQSLYVVGFTGTNGKTTCSQLYAQLSALLGKRSGIVGTLGYGCCSPTLHADHKTHLSLATTGMTTPDAIRTQAICAELLADGSDNLSIEVSSHGLEQGRVAALNINTAVFTNLSHDHLDYHGDMATYGQAKAKLFSMPSLNSAVVNMDDSFSEQLLDKMGNGIDVITYSVNNTSANIYLSNIHYQSSKIDAILNTPKGIFSVSTHLVGEFNLSNLLAVLSVFYLEHDDFNEVVANIPYLLSIPGRMESISNNLDKHIVIDYAHTPDALKNALLALKSNTHSNLWCVFGCGGERDKDKRAVMAAVAEKYADYVVVTNDNPRNENAKSILLDIEKGFKQKNYTIIEDRAKAICFSIEQCKERDIVLIAGKGHEDYQLIGDKKYPFSDQKTARLVVRHLEESVND